LDPEDERGRGNEKLEEVRPPNAIPNPVTGGGKKKNYNETSSRITIRDICIALVAIQKRECVEAKTIVSANGDDKSAKVVSRLREY